MPYDLRTKSGIILRNIPDHVPPDAPELKALAQQQMAARAEPAPQMSVSDPGEAARMATEGMGWGQKALVNIGAGVDTAIKGVQQIGGKLGIGGGVSDDELKEKRALDEGLADNTTGGKLLQIVGEGAPTAVIPFGTFAKGGSMLAKTLGARRAAGALNRGVTKGVADSALAGAATGALGPVTSDESRVLNATLGGALGGTLSAVGSAARAGYGAMTRSGAQRRAARMAQEAAGDDPATLRRLGRYVMDQPDIPLSSAAAAQNPGLARLEAGARARNGAEFYDLDQRQGRAVFENVMRDTEEAAELAARKGERRAEWDSNWRTAETVADPQVFQQQMDAFVPALQQAMRSPEASNPAVRGVLESIANEIERNGDAFSPAHLQQIRANLSGRQKPLPQNAYQAAPRESPAVQSLLTQIDNILNETTSGAWDAVKGGYAQSSRGVDASKAAGRVREAFIDPSTGRTRGTALDPRGEIPAVTESGLGRALDAARGPDRTDQLSEAASGGLNRTLDALRRQGIVQRVKKSATAGGGSNTQSDRFAAAAAGAALPGGSAARMVWDFASDLANARRDAALNEALRDPQEMIRLLTLASRAPGDLTPAQRTLVQLLRSTGAVGAGDLAQAPAY